MYVDPTAAARSVVASRLQPPRRRRGHITRTDLLEYLRLHDPDVLLVSAAAGYGKSTLLADVAANDPRPSAWLSLDPAHNEASVLLSDIAFVLNQLEPIDGQMRADLGTHRLSIASTATQRFGRMLATRRQPFVLVLDDVHVLTSTEALDALRVVVDELPPGSLLVLGGRSLPDLPFGRLRAKRTVVEFGHDDLGLTPSALMAMCSALAVEVSPAEAMALVEHTEGWPLALYLAVLARRGDPGREIPLEVSGDTRVMVEYFSDVILAGISPDVSSLLLHVAPLERFSGPLCDAVLQRRDSAALIEDLHRRNLLVVALDERRQWYRLHHLLAEYLTTELERRTPGATTEILLGASRWHEHHGDVESAITCAARAGDLDHTAELLVANYAAFTNLGRLATIERWLGYFTTSELSARPLLLVAASQAAHISGDGDGALGWLERAMLAIGPERPLAVEGWQPPLALAVARASMGWLNPVEMRAEAEYAVGRLRHGAYWQPLSSMLSGVGALLTDDTAAAERHLRNAISGATDRPLARSLSYAALTLLYVDQGRADDAVRAADGIDSLLDAWSAVPAACLAIAVRSLAAARRGEFDESTAAHQFARRQLTGFAPVSPWLNMLVRLALARASATAGRSVETITLLDEIDTYLIGMPEATAVARQVADIRRSVAAGGTAASFGPSSLTTAELRVLQYLPTHLSVGEIADRLYLSRNTVKTHTVAIYRKLGTSSRSGAVEVARAAGLIG